MLLDLKPILDNPGAKVDFTCELDFSDFTFGAQSPVTEPVVAQGEVVNMAGIILLRARIQTVLHCECDLCAEAFELVKDQRVEAVLTEEPDEEDEEAYPIVGERVDVDEVITSAFVLEMDSRFICKPDCKGMCARCGANLNDGPCGCGEEIDPRWAALQGLF